MAKKKRVDPFSSLPSELLDSIFLLAFPERLGGSHGRGGKTFVTSLSKHLLNFTQERLYSHISLTRYRQLDQLYHTLHRRPDLARYARNITIMLSRDSRRDEEPDSTIARKIRKILRLLPELRGFSQDGWMGKLAAYELMKVPLPNLTKISISICNIGESVDLDDLNWLSQLPNLDTLNIHSWEGFEDVENPELTTFNVKSLSVRGCSVGLQPIRVLIESCPRLVNLRLETRIDDYDEPSGFEAVAPFLPTNLETLSLTHSPRSYDEDDSPIDPHLPRFSRLRHLELDGQMYTSRIYRALSKLPHLQSLTLKGHRASLNGIRTLVKGPKRSPYLRSITLGSYWARESLSDSPRDEGDERILLRDQGDPLDLLREACARQGITIEGLDIVREIEEHEKRGRRRGADWNPSGVVDEDDFDWSGSEEDYSD